LKNRKSPGQIVVVITLFIAVLILFSIILVNLAQVSNVKTATSQIADRGTLGVCSQLSTYSNALVQRIQQKCSLLGGCTACSTTHTACFRWWLIILSIGVLTGIVLSVFPVTLPAGIVLFALVANPLINEVHAIMRGGLSNAAASMTEYTSIRESSILSMLELAQNDPVEVERVGSSDVFQDSDSLQYDLTGTPVAAEVKNKSKIPRFAAWYWSRRFSKVSEAGLGPYIDEMIKSLLNVTELAAWDKDKWKYTKVSLKVSGIDDISCAAGSCPEWADPANQSVRILQNVSAIEPVSWDTLWNWLNSLLGGTNDRGFLPLKFVELTKRLLDSEYAGDISSWASKTAVTLPFGLGNWSVTYDLSDIWKTVEALRGVMIRDMEILNLSVSERIPTMGSWLPVWYDAKDPEDADTIYGMLGAVLTGNDQIKGLNKWIADLQAIDDKMKVTIAAANGHNEYGQGGVASMCSTQYCCSCDCSVTCCNPGPCIFYGIYCTACGGPNPPVCSSGDLYGTQPTSSSGIKMCPLENLSVDCACPDCSRAPACPDACNFQGQLWTYAYDSPTEVGQAIKVLSALRDALVKLRADIAAFAVKADSIMYPTDLALIELQKQVVYGWKDKNGYLNIARVRLDKYLDREDFPYIQESYDWAGLWKKWDIKGVISGDGPEITVSRYYSDVPAGWWNLKYRQNPASNEFDKTALGQIIDEIQGAGSVSAANSGKLNDLLDNYAITSSTKGKYGLAKEDIAISRIK